MRKLSLVLIIPAFLAGCSEDKKSDKPKPSQVLTEDGGGLGEALNQNTITVTNESGAPLANAKILIGWGRNNPFNGNFLTTDAKGQIQVPAEWTTALPITVQAPGHVRLTHFARQPGAWTFQLRPATKEPTLELGGQTTGHVTKDRDGIVDFGLVMSALSRNDVLAFDLNRVISSQTDTLTIAGQKLEIPSNVTLPNQKESYILPITLNKPNYRLYFGDRGIQRVFAARGSFPMKTVIDEVRAKKEFYELINHFNITGGVIRDVNIGSSRVSQNLPVNEINFSAKRTVKAPAFRADEVMVALGVADTNGYLVPTDVKRLNQNESMPLAVLTDRSPHFVGVLKKQDEFKGPDTDRLSAVILPFQNNMTPQFLPLINKPRFAANGDLLLPKPQNIRGVNDLATYSILSEVRELGSGETKFPFLMRLWEVYAPEWIDTLNLPVWPEGTPMPAKKRWEVTYIGSATRTQADLGQPVIDAATHVTHSSLDF